MRARLAFLGSPEFAVPSLVALARSHEVVWVLTQPDRPAGRGRHLEPTPVRRTAERLGIPVETYTRERRVEIDAALRDLQLDVLVVVAFGHILKPGTLAAARCGAVNVHASLLPRWRGVAPIERALQAGDAMTGVTLMQIDAGVDTGGMLAQRLVAIDATDTRSSLGARLAAEGAELLCEALGDYVAGQLLPVAQPEGGVSYAPRLEKHEGAIDWSAPPLCIWRQVRAFYGWPGAFTHFAGETLKVHAVRPIDLIGRGEAGTLVAVDVASGVRVACGSGTLELLEVQRPNRRPVSGREWAAAVKAKPGDRFLTVSPS